MTQAYQQLKTIAESAALVRALTNHEVSVKFPLSVEHQGIARVLYLTSSRGKQPACIVVSRDVGQPASPSAGLVAMRRDFMIQVFEEGADDLGVDNPGAEYAYRIESKGRALQC